MNTSRIGEIRYTACICVVNGIVGVVPFPDYFDSFRSDAYQTFYFDKHDTALCWTEWVLKPKNVAVFDFAQIRTPDRSAIRDISPVRQVFGGRYSLPQILSDCHHVLKATFFVPLLPEGVTFKPSSQEEKESGIDFQIKEGMRLRKALFGEEG